MDFEQSRYFSTARVQADTGNLAVFHRNKVFRVSFKVRWFVDRRHSGNKKILDGLEEVLYMSLRGVMAVHARSHSICPRGAYSRK